MNPMMNAVILQVLSMLIPLLIGIVFIWFLMGNFLFKFIKVKSSRGASKLVKIREIDHDAFAIGVITEGFLIFKYKGDVRRIPLPTEKEKQNYFYRALGVTWIDFDSEKNAIGLHDYSTVTGHDAIKTQNFLKRILMMSQLKTDMSVIIIILICLVIIGIIATVFLTIRNGNEIAAIKMTLQALNTTIAPPPSI